MVDIVPDYSVMVIERADAPEAEYEISIHTPNSPAYADWLAVCNQTMPGGGKQPRKFGWF